MARIKYTSFHIVCKNNNDAFFFNACQEAFDKFNSLDIPVTMYGVNQDGCIVEITSK